VPRWIDCIEDGGSKYPPGDTKESILGVNEPNSWQAACEPSDTMNCTTEWMISRQPHVYLVGCRMMWGNARA